ncbi:MAG: N-acetyl-gamma-glutamyl-phosphate reductase [Bacteroidales bacterium]|jgi:N-acetyl-gamma-glutamyl-phosphate reductase|nr:N-acetyl-gamma-glutamyl-phosphate reductase [Bacteroidales bacterium]
MENKSITVGIVGGAGYTAGELIRILLNHPHATINFVHSTSHAGHPVYAVHRDLLGDTELRFTDAISDVDVIFLCLGHGLSAEFLDKYKIAEHTRIIDLSSDFRIQPAYQNRNFVYGLPEIFKDEIARAKNVANPGCFATAIQLALLPLAQKDLLNDDVHVNALTGSSGAGRGRSDTTHFSYRENNISIYKAFTHQHLGEINKTLTTAQKGKSVNLNFIPMRGDFTRGIFATVYTKCDLPKDEIVALYTKYYEIHPFTHISKQEISMKEVINTNKCMLHIDKHGDNVLITSIIDNLIKGASGQAIQNMNLMFGLLENEGLKLKSIVF